MFQQVIKSTSKNFFIGLLFCLERKSTMRRRKRVNEEAGRASDQPAVNCSQKQRAMARHCGHRSGRIQGACP
jgi:hypothetical protein